MKRIFVTGTDTDVGKTVVSAALVVGLRARYWKPVQAGTHEPTDTEKVRRWTGLPEDRFLPEAYRLRAPMSPHAAAELDGVDIDIERILRTELPVDAPVVIEGAGGLMVPLTGETLLADVLQAMAVPAVLVARTGLGTLNHTLLSISEMRRRAIPILGVVLNGDTHESNHRAIERLGRVPVLGRMPRLDPIDRAGLAKAFEALDLPD